MSRRLEERKKMLINERDQLLKLKKENRVRMDTQTREESELAKVCLFNFLIHHYYLLHLRIRKLQIWRTYCRS
jgi:hypothetical protein